MRTSPHEQAKVAQKWASNTAERRIAAHDVRHLCGGISDMSLWRWLNDLDLNFPRPIYIGKRRYWREADVLEWLESQPETAD